MLKWKGCEGHRDEQGAQGVWRQCATTAQRGRGSPLTSWNKLDMMRPYIHNTQPNFTTSLHPIIHCLLCIHIVLCTALCFFWGKLWQFVTFFHTSFWCQVVEVLEGPVEEEEMKASSHGLTWVDMGGLWTSKRCQVPRIKARCIADDAEGWLTLRGCSTCCLIPVSSDSRVFWLLFLRNLVGCWNMLELRSQLQKLVGNDGIAHLQDPKKCAVHSSKVKWHQ